jgi:glutaryl-CoA dehydrogenase
MMPRNSEASTSVTSDRWLLPEVRHGEAADDPLDFLALDTLLSSEEKSVRARTRKFIADELEPHISEWFQGRVPIRELGREFGRRGFFGSLIGSSNDTPPAVSFGLSMLEFEAADTGLRQFISTQDNLVMFALARYGSPEQRGEWLPRLRTGEAIGCFGMTEPQAGSDASGIRTFATRDGNDWVLNGRKRWITNAVDADVAIVWAQTEEGLRGFVVPTATKGFSAVDIAGKVSMRHSSSADLRLEDVRLPHTALMPLTKGVSAPLSCTNEARYGILWGAVGAARSSYEAALRRARERQQFGKPLAAFQMTQQRLVEMCSKVNRAGLLALHLGRLREAGRATAAQLSLGKLENVRIGLEVAREARAMHGGDGVTLGYPAIRHASNLEAVSTYEGTHEMHTLAIGKALTGVSAFR